MWDYWDNLDVIDANNPGNILMKPMTLEKLSISLHDSWLVASQFLTPATTKPKRFPEWNPGEVFILKWNGNIP
jgi:hypothetical protein